MPGSTTYRGNTQPFNRRIQRDRDRETARQAAEEALAKAMRDASPIVTPPTRRSRPTTAETAIPSNEATPKQES